MSRRCTRNRALRGLVALAMVIVALGLLLPGEALSQNDEERGPLVWVAEAEGVINPPLADYLKKTISRANNSGVDLIVIEMDTPGGLDAAMRVIIQAEIDSRVPVAVYVSPQGARAASAGLYIMMGADVAAMAPQTNLGSAQPVALEGELDEEMKKKVVNDAAAYIRGLATTNGRNAEWAELAVRESVSLTSTEALDEGVIEFVAQDLDDLLDQLDGFTTVEKKVTIRTAGAHVERVPMSWWEGLLHVVANPQIAFILLLVGVYGIIFEVQSPGVGVPGIIGGLSLLLALYGLQVLPVTFLGIALILLAVGLYVAELFIQSFGLLTLAGTVALVFGALLLFDPQQPYFQIEWYVIVITASFSALFFGVVLTAVVRARRARPTTGRENIVGSPAVATTQLTPYGFVMAQGELWRAALEPDEPAQEEPEHHEDLVSVRVPAEAAEGERLEVVGLDGLTLRVRRVPKESDSEVPSSDVSRRDT